MKLYAVRYDNATTANYNKQIYTPTNNSYIATYDASTTVFDYTGIPTSTTNDTKYRYQAKSISSLSWPDNEGKVIETGHSAIKMSSPTSYYYMNSIYWGTLTGIPNPGGSGTIRVPEGAIGFTVQGATGSGNRVKFK